MQTDHEISVGSPEVHATTSCTLSYALQNDRAQNSSLGSLYTTLFQGRVEFQDASLLHIDSPDDFQSLLLKFSKFAFSHKSPADIFVGGTRLFLCLLRYLGGVMQLLVYFVVVKLVFLENRLE